MGTSVQCTYVLLTALLGVTCGLRLPLRVWLFAWPLAKIVAVMPITQGGIGVREAALVVFARAVWCAGVASSGNGNRLGGP